MGFLYLRYVLNPRKVWEWIEPYLADPEVGVQPRACGSEPKPTLHADVEVHAESSGSSVGPP